jgi:transcription elongation factor GreA
MMKKTMFLTQEGFENLKAELEDLKTRQRAEVTEAIKRAREMGDLSENNLYDQARQKQSFIEGRIQELEGILSSAQVIEASADGTVSLGSQVTVHVEGDEEEFMLVGEAEADPSRQKISNTSPLGQALLGKKVGDEVAVEAPVGAITYRILKVG